MSGYAPTLRRHELKEEIKNHLLRIAESLIPEEPGREDLKAARKHHPSFFGGLFPTLGFRVARAQGTSVFVDKPSRPALLIVEIKIYYPCLPVRGPQSQQQDRSGEADRITSYIEDVFIEKIFEDRKLGPYVSVADSQPGSINEAGRGITDERGQEVLWIARTELHVST